MYISLNIVVMIILKRTGKVASIRNKYNISVRKCYNNLRVVGVDMDIILKFVAQK